MRRGGLVAAMALTALVALAGCGSDEASTTSPSAAAPSPIPTPAPVVWADGVCAARDNLTAAVSALGRNLSYDITSNRSALEQIDRQLRIQVISVANAADELGTALAAVPVDFQQANDLVVSVTKAKEDTSEAIDQVTTSLDAMMNAENVVAGVAEAGRALVAGKAAFKAGQVLVSSVTSAASTANDDVRAAFDAAPGCQDTPEPSAS